MAFIRRLFRRRRPRNPLALTRYERGMYLILAQPLWRSKRKLG